MTDIDRALAFLAEAMETHGDEVRSLVAKGARGRGIGLALAKHRRRWVTVEGHEVVALADPTPRGAFLDTAVARPQEPGDPDRVLYAREAVIEQPDGKPDLPPVEPRAATIRVPRRARVLDGRGW